MKNVIPYLFTANCSEALEYYKRIFGGETKNIQPANPQMFKNAEGKLMHAELHINSSCILYMADIFESKPDGSQISLLIEADNEEEINRLFNELKRGGTVQFELQKTFWGAYHAVLTDKYGIHWSLNFSVK